jgi:hypothetical protein
MLKSELLAALRTELHRHDFSHFVDEPLSVAQGGRGVVVPGCPTCKKKFGTMPQFLDHLTDDVLPAVLDRLSAEKLEAAVGLEPAKAGFADQRLDRFGIAASTLKIQSG